MRSHRLLQTQQEEAALQGSEDPVHTAVHIPGGAPAGALPFRKGSYKLIQNMKNTIDQDNTPSQDNYFLSADYWLAQKYRNKNGSRLTKWESNLIFTLLFLFTFAVAVLAGETDAANMAVFSIIFLGPSAGNLVSMTDKLHKNRLYRVFLRCGKELDGIEYFSVSALADRVHISERSLIKSLHDMKKLGWLPNATFSEDDTLVLLTDDARDRYNAVSNASRNLQGSTIQGDSQENALLLGRDDQKMASRTAEQISAGLAAAEEIRRIDDAIPGTSMSERLSRLARLIRRICSEVEAHPDRIQIISRFSDYYLPTVMKLVRRYQELDAESYPTMQTQKSMDEIRDALDTACTAFENLLIRIQSDSSLETSVDISVMKKIMEQDGLVPSEQISDDKTPES